MKSLNVWVQLACVVLPLALTGCKSSDAHTRADSTASTMDTMGGVVATAKANSLAVGKSLQAVIDNARTDPAAAFSKFKADLAAAKSSRDALYSRDAGLQSQGNSYLAEWEKSNAAIVDPDLKKLGEGRRNELQTTLADVAKPMNALRASLDPFLASAQDLQTYLSSDLTPASLDAVSGKAGKCSKEAKSLEGLFDNLESALTKAAPKFKVAKPPPPAAK
jgi:hypothetical protein